MRRVLRAACTGLFVLLCAAGLPAEAAQRPIDGAVGRRGPIEPIIPGQPEPSSLPGPGAAPTISALHLIKFSGAATDAQGQPLQGTAGVTFALYADQQGGSPLWLETQNITLDSQGRYTALLGSMSNEGLPLEIFASGEARWLGITVQGQPEQPRVLLVSVPYALKAADAETLGGKPASAYVLSPTATTGDGQPSSEDATASSTSSTGGSAVTVSGTVGRIAKFTAADTVNDSALFEDNSGKIGLGTTTPVEQLDIAGPSRTRINLGNQSTVQFASSGFSMRLTQAVDAHTQWDFFAEKNAAGSATGQTTFQIRRRNSAQTEAVTPILIDKDTNVILQAGFKAGSQTFGNVGIGTAAPTQKLQVLGNVRITGAGNGVIFNDGSTLKTAAGNLRGITYLAGCDSCSVLTDADDQKAIYFNVIGAMTINSVTCFSDAGTPTINLQRDNGTPANILSSNLACSTSGASTTTFVGGQNVLNLNDKLDFVMVTAGGVAKRATVIIKATLN